MNIPLAVFLIFGVTLSLSFDHFTMCLKEIAYRYFDESYLTVVYWTGPIWRKKSLLYEEMLVSASEDEIIKSLSENEKWTFKTYYGDGSGKSDLTVDHRTRQVIFLLDSNIITNPTKIKEQIKRSKMTMGWRAQGLILIIIRSSPVANALEKARLVLEALWAYMKSCNTLVLVAEGEHQFPLYKWYPFTDECHKVGEIDQVDVWINGSFTERKDLFAENGITNLNGCPLRVGAFPNPPYVLEPVGSRTDFTKGLDIKIVQQLAEIYNFTISFTTLPEGKFPYIIFDSEGKASGFHGMLQRQELDIMIFGCRIHELRNMLADPLDSYVEDALVWVVPTPRHVPSWRNLGDAFTPTVWLLFGVFFVLVSITLYLIANYQENSSEHSTLRTYVCCVLSSLGVLLNNSVARPRSTLLRLFMFLFSLFAINANSAYQSSLIALLTDARYEKPYETPLDAVQGGVKTYLFPSGNITYNQTDHAMWNIIFQPDRHAFIEDFAPVIREIALDKTAMVMMAENVVKFEVRTKYMTQDNTPRVLFLKEKFSLYRVTAYVSSGHPLREHFRRKVNQMVEGGLVGYWMDEVEFTSVQQFVGKQEDHGTQPLTLRHLQGPFYILLIALVISLQVFCFEVLVQKIINNIKLKF